MEYVDWIQKNYETYYHSINYRPFNLLGFKFFSNISWIIKRGENNMKTGQKRVTNINYINNINYDKQQKLINASQPIDDVKTTISKTKPDKPAIVDTKKELLPSTFKSVKVDLFDNATVDEMMMDRRKLKINLNIIKQDQTRVTLTAALNTPIKTLRHRTKSYMDTQHYRELFRDYELVRSQQLESGVEYVTASRFYISGKQQTTKGFSVLYYRTSDKHYADVYVGGIKTPLNIISFRLSTSDLSKSQRNKNIIASASKSQQTYKEVDAEDWLL
tara:strand:- start:516 stop:1337 length:822 start_codon:yes stop_codon:yes gene_type:complete